MTFLLFAFLSLDPVPLNDKPSDVIAVDLNKDGKLDLVVLCEHGVRTVLREGTGWKTVTQLDLSGSPVSLAAGDFNRDGNLDLALADHDTFGVQILQGDGKGGMIKAGMVRAKTTGEPHVHGLQTGDFNRDGAVDVLYISSGEGEVVPLLNNGKGAFTAGKPVKLGKNAWHPAVGDVNGDGNLDVVGAEFDGDKIAVALGDGKGSFQLGAVTKVFGRPFYPKLADLDGDANLDIISVHDDHGRFTILRGDGKGGFSQVAGSPVDIGREAYGLAAEDCNGDGKLDLIAAAGDELIVFVQKGKMQFEKSAKRTTGIGGFHITKADLDGDGKAELIIADTMESRVEFFSLRQ